jgi:polysaccharide biosynthesis/export protein
MASDPRMNTISVALRCGVLSCMLLSDLGRMQGAAGDKNLPGHAAQAAQAANNEQQPSASDGSKANALAANRADPSAEPNDTAKPTAGSSVRNSPSPASNTPIGEDYRIGAGDVLHISVWKEPDASIPAIVVRPDGKITMPLLKDIEVVGMTPREAESIISRGLASFITEPNVTVIVTGINSKKVYIIGAVKREGPLAYTYRMTIMQALTEAGGLTDYAKRKKIYVLRAAGGKETKIPFDYDAVLKGKDPDHIWLLPDDTLVVPH